MLKFDSLVDVCREVVNFNTLLLHCVAVTDCNRTVLLGVKVVCDAEGSTYLVLSAVTLAYAARLVLFAHKLGRKLCVYLPRALCELL